MTGLEAEWRAFVQAFLSGMIVYWGYFCICKLRRVIRHNLIAISIEDLLFWVATAIYLFVQVYYTSNGSVRWSFALGVVFGAAFMHGSKCMVEKKCRKKQK